MRQAVTTGVDTTPAITEAAPHTAASRWERFNIEQKVFVWLAAVFVTSLVVANLVGAYLFTIPLPFSLPFAGDRALLSAGIIAFPVTFILTDLLNEFYGQKGARFVTFTGLGMSVLAFMIFWAGEQVTPAENTVISREEYLAFSANYSGMFIASLTAYLVGQLLDIFVFHQFKKVTKNRFLWLRATGSTVISQVFDSLIVTFIAFADNLPVEVILTIAASNYVWKFLIAVGVTPFLYVGQITIRRTFRLAG